MQATQATQKIIFRNCSGILQKVFWLDVFVFVCALGVFCLFRFFLRQTDRNLPHHRSRNASKNSSQIIAR